MIAAPFRRAWRWARRVVLRRPPREHEASLELGSIVTMGSHATLETGTTTTDVEGRLDYLMREAKRTQERLTGSSA